MTVKISSKIRFIKNRQLAILAFLVVLIISFAGILYYYHQANELRKEKSEELKAVSSLKIEQIVNWQNERISDIKIIAESKKFIELTYGLLKNIDDNNIKENVIERLRLVKQNKMYQDVLLLSPAGEIILNFDPNKNQVDVPVETVNKAVENKRIETSDLYISKIDEDIYFDIVSPIIVKDSVVAAVLIFRSNPTNYLFPLIETWPTKSLTAELIVVRKEADSVLILNELKHKKNSALKFRIPIFDNKTASANAALGYSGIYEGKDYRNVEVLSNLSAIPKTNWFMVAKIDKSEVFSQLKYLTLTIFLFVGFIVSVMSAGITLNNKSKQEKVYRKLLEKEKELSKSNIEFKTTLYSIGDAVISTDNKGNVQKLNPMAEKLTGWKESEARGKKIDQIYKVVNEGPTGNVANRIKKTLEEGAVYGLTNHTLLISKSGKKIQIADNSSPIKDDSGEIIGVVITFRDQTKEYAHKQELVESERKFRTIIEGSPLPKIITDLDGNIETINDSFIRILGYTIEEIPNIDEWWCIAYPDEKYRKDIQDKWLTEMELAIKDERPSKTFEATIRCKNGNDRIFSVVGNKIGDKILVIFNDLTERIKAEEDRDRFFNVTLDLLCIAGTDGYFKQLNPAWVDALGWSIEELKTKPFLDFIHPDDLDSTLKEVAKLKEGQPAINFVNRYQCKDGSYKVLNWVSAPFGDILYASATDITDLKNTQQKLAESEKLFKGVYSDSPVSLWVEDWTEVIAMLRALDEKDLKNISSFLNENKDFVLEALSKVKILDVNKETLLMFETETKETLLQSLEVVFATDDTLPGFIDELIALAKGKETFETEMKLNTAKGNMITTLLRMTFPSKDDNSGQVLVSIMDISQLIETEELLKTSEYELKIRNEIAKIFLTNSEDEMYVNVLSIILEVLKSEFGVFGYIDEEKDALIVPTMTREIWTECSVPEKNVEFPRSTWGNGLWCSALRENKTMYSNNPSTNIPDGHLQIYRNLAVPISNKNKVIGLLQVANKKTDYSEADINLLQSIADHIAPIMAARLEKNKEERERIKAQNDLIEASNRLEIALDGGKIGVWQWDLSTNSIEWDERMDAVFGLETGSFGGDYESFVKTLFEEDIDLVRNAVEDAINGVKPYNIVYRIITPNNKMRYVNAVGIVIKDNNGKPIKMLGVCFDVTELKNSEENLIRLMSELERSNHELEQFAYVASHDLQEPLRMVSSYTQLLEQRYKDKLDKDANDFIHFAVDGASRMQVLINDLLQYSRITTKGKEYQKTDINVLLGNAVVNLKSKIEETTSFITHDELPEIFVDPSQITRVFQNLISNAIKYKSEENPYIHISAREKSDCYEFIVRDNGIGIAPKYYEKIFEIFQRLHTKDAYEGTGIGLAICKRIIERHRGIIWVDSEEGKGSTFHFTISKKLG